MSILYDTFSVFEPYEGVDLIAVGNWNRKTRPATESGHGTTKAAGLRNKLVGGLNFQYYVS